MRARELKRILNNTGYNVHFMDGKVCIGSPMCSDLISVDIWKKQIKYAMDTFKEGRKAIHHKELEFIWDTLGLLLECEWLEDIATGDDVLENPLTVYFEKDGRIHEAYTDAYGWPNVTHDGRIMYNNSYFKTRREAIESGIRNHEAGLEWTSERIRELQDNLHKVTERYKTDDRHIQSLNVALTEEIIKTIPGNK